VVSTPRPRKEQDGVPKATGAAGTAREPESSNERRVQLFFSIFSLQQGQALRERFSHAVVPITTDRMKDEQAASSQTMQSPCVEGNILSRQT
jgi:hypothetical protein